VVELSFYIYQAQELELEKPSVTLTVLVATAKDKTGIQFLQGGLRAKVGRPRIRYYVKIEGIRKNMG